MSSPSDKEFAVATVYAQAALQLAESRGEADRALDELTGLVEMLNKSRDLEAFLSDPTVDMKARQRTIEKAFRGRIGDLCVDLLQVMNRRDRLGLLRAVAEAYRLAHQELRNLVEVHVRAAAPLTPEMRAKIAEISGRLSSKKPAVTETVDSSLIGGLVVRIGDRKFDMSVVRELRDMGRALLDRASREIQRGVLPVQE